MYIKNVFLGVTLNDGKERLLYRKYVTYNDTTFSEYIDLRTKEKFMAFDIDAKSLIPYSTRLEKKFSTKRMVVNVYKSGERLIHSENLYIGDMCKVEWISNNNISSRTHFSDNSVPMDVIKIDENRVYVKLDECDYKDLVTNEIISVRGNYALTEGDFCVDNLKEVSKVLGIPKCELVNKNLVLRKKYEKYQK